MLLRFTKKFSRPKLGLIVALSMLILPALVDTTAANAQRTKAKPTPTPRKKATPTPKKSQAKSKPTPKPTPKSKNTAKTTAKTVTKTPTKTTSKTTTSKTGKVTANSKSSNKSKNTNPKNAKSAAVEKSRSRSTTSKNTTTKPKTSTSSTKNTVAVKTFDNQPQIIVTTFSVPIRSQANAGASTVSKARLGTVLKVTEKNPAWYKIQYNSGGKTSAGWISANAVNDLNSSGKTELYHQIVERNYNSEMDFNAASEFFEFLSKVDGELDSSDKSAEIRLKRLLALRSALKTIPSDKSDAAPYKDFLKAQDKEIVYNEPGGQWLVTSNQFWSLHDRFKKSTVSDTIAWEAANNPLPGECEGYVNCYLFDMRMRFGEYLNLHPNGKNSAEALKNVTDYLSPIAADATQKSVYNGPTDVTDRAEFNNLIAELRTIVARVDYVEKEKTLLQLRQIAEAYR